MTEGLASVVKQLERQKAAIDRALVALREVDGVREPTAAAQISTVTPAAPARKGKKLSAAVRKRMKEAQQLRWAKIRGESQPQTPVPAAAPKAKRRISPEGMKRIIAATKKRWALKRAEAQKTAPKTVKKAGAGKAVAKKSAKAAGQAPTTPAA